MGEGTRLDWENMELRRTCMELYGNVRACLETKRVDKGIAWSDK
jgi:hypothetical protein